MNVLEVMQAVQEELLQGYYEQDWSHIEAALEILGVNPEKTVFSVKKTPKKKSTSKRELEVQPEPQKSRGRPKKTQTVTAPQVTEDFRVVGRQAQNNDGFEDVPLGPRKNLFVDTRDDDDSNRRVKSPRTKKTYKNESEYLRAEVYTKTRSAHPRPPVKKVTMTCGKCGAKEELYENRVIYKDVEEGIFYCNRCAGGK